MQKVCDVYAQVRGVEAKDVRLVYNGDRITGDFTPLIMGLEENAQIDVILATVGC